MKIAFVTNICPHYMIRLYEMIAGQYSVEYFFTGGYEDYWSKKNKKWTGDFHGKYLKGLLIAPKFKITPGLFALFFGRFDAYVKTIDDRFAIIMTFLVAKITRKPFILWTGLWHHPQSLIHRITFGVTKFIYRNSDAIVTYGDHVKRYLTELGIDEQKIFTAPHSIDNTVFNRTIPQDERDAFKSLLSLKDGLTVLYVGRLETCKGLDYLIEALSSTDTSSLNVLLIGNGEEGERYKDLCRKNNLPCRFLGHVPNVELIRYYNVADIFVLPSITTENEKEPWGLVVNEAMNQGLPIVTTEAVGAARGGLVEDGKNGFVVPERDSSALREAMEKILSDDRLRHEMRASSLSRIRGWNTEQTMKGFQAAVQYVNRSGTEQCGGRRPADRRGQPSAADPGKPGNVEQPREEIRR